MVSNNKHSPLLADIKLHLSNISALTVENFFDQIKYLFYRTYGVYIVEIETFLSYMVQTQF